MTLNKIAKSVATASAQSEVFRPEKTANAGHLWLSEREAEETVTESGSIQVKCNGL
jgi:hypothetical protein